MKKTAIVILNWNGRKLLEKFLPSVIQYSSLPDVSIVVADNGSTDDSIAFVSREYPQVELITLSQNYGFADGYNRALKKIEAEYYILLNSDVEVTDNWLSVLIEYMDHNPEVAATQPKIKAQQDKDHFEYAGASGGFIDKYGYPFCRGRIFKTVEADEGQYDDPINVLWASGACLMIRSKDFFEVGGFDSTFFAHMEEIDLCWRLNSRGKRIVCLPSSTVFHVGAATLKKESPHKTYLNFRNNLLMLYKNLPQKYLRKTMFVRLILDYIAVIQLTLTGKYANAKQVIRSHKYFFNNRHLYRQARENNLKEMTTEWPSTIYTKSILFAYYLRRIRLFSKLQGFN